MTFCFCYCLQKYKLYNGIQKQETLEIIDHLVVITTNFHTHELIFKMPLSVTIINAMRTEMATSCIKKFEIIFLYSVSSMCSFDSGVIYLFSSAVFTIYRIRDYRRQTRIEIPTYRQH